MSSNVAVNETYQRVMAHTGFYHEGVPTTGVTESEEIRNNNKYLEKRIKYSAVIDTEKINATAIYELSGSVCPERSIDFRLHGILQIGAEHIKKLPVFNAAFDSDILKVATWGSARDIYLIQKLRTLPKIEEIAENSLKNGFKVGNQKHVISEELLGKKWLPSGQMNRYKIDTNELETLPYTKLESPRDSQIYKAPLIIISEKVEPDGICAAFSESDIVYTKSYSGITISRNLIHLAYYLNGVINSSIANYFIFMTASSWGIERKKVMTQDLVQLPIPKPSEHNQIFVNQIIEIEGKLREFSPSKSVENNLKKQLDEAVFNLYGLDDNERVLVEDTT